MCNNWDMSHESSLQISEWRHSPIYSSYFNTPITPLVIESKAIILNYNLLAKVHFTSRFTVLVTYREKHIYREKGNIGDYI